MSDANLTDPPADEPWLPHDTAEGRGLCPQRSDGFNDWREHDPSCNMHARWAARWGRDPESMRTPRRGVTTSPADTT